MLQRVRRIQISNITIFLLWIVASFVWISTMSGRCQSNYYANFSEYVNYDQVLLQHTPLNDFNNPLNALAVSLVVGVILWIRTGRGWPGILFLLLIPLACWMMLGQMFCDQTTIRHIESVEFDGRTIHLALGDDVAGGADVYSQIVFLHECERGRERCRGREIYQTYTGRLDEQGLHIAVDEQRRQLQIGTQKETFFVLDSTTLPLTLPPDLEVIGLENVTRLRPLGTFQHDFIGDIAWSSDGTVLAADGNNSIRLYQFLTDSVSMEILLSDNATDIAFSPTAPLLASTNSLDGPVQFWDTEHLTELRSLDFSYTEDIAFSPDGRLFATAPDGQLQLIDVETLHVVATLGSFEWYDFLESFTFSPDGKWFAVNGADDEGERDTQFIRIWNTQTYAEVFLYQPPAADKANDMAFEPDGTRLAFSTSDEYPDCSFESCMTTLRIWDIRSNQELIARTLPDVSGNGITRLIWTPNGEVLIGTDPSGQLIFWNPVDGEQIASQSVESRYFGGLALSADGRVLAIGDNQGVHLWGVVSEQGL